MRSCKHVFTYVILLLLVLWSIASPLAINAQVAGATISGTITDQSGAAIPKAQISIKNVGTDVIRTAETNEDGFYSVPNLVAGEYQVTVGAQGFESKVSRITLAVGSQRALNLSLQVARKTESVQVIETPSTVQLASSDLSGVVDANSVRELPLNGRDWTQLATLQPGVSLVRTEKAVAVGADRGNRGYGAQMSVAGGRPQQNNYRIDGISINDYSNGAPGSVIGLDLGVDAIQEFSVLSSNYSAEYGKASGGVINAITRSGTNQFHGSAYEFFRNSALDARNFFDGPTIPAFKRNQFGASVGGPIKKGNTFFFVDYEGLRQSLGFTQVDTVPSPAARSRAVASVQPYLGFYPLPNGAILGSGDIGVFTFAGQQVTPEDYVTTRLDHNFSEKDSLYGSYLFDNGKFSQPDSLNDILLLSQTRRQLLTMEETHIFSPTLVNSLRFGVSRIVAHINNTAPGGNSLAGNSSLGSIPGQNAPPIIVPGLTTFGGGLGAPSHFDHFWTSIQLYDDAFMTRGSHLLKFGVALERDDYNIYAFSNPGGLFNFSSLSSFLAGQATNFSSAIPGTLSPRGLRQTIFGLYLQDDVKVLPHLTLNLGMRYEMSTVPTEVQDKLSTLRQITNAQPHLGNPFFSNPTLHNFEPRVGFAWDPFGNGTTALRGGFGIYDVLPLLYQDELLASLAAPFAEIGTATGLTANAFPNGVFSLISASPTTLRQTYIEPHPHRNYVMQWNLDIQRQLPGNATLSVGYVGSHGVHQPFRSDEINTVLPAATAQGLLWPSPAGSGTKLNPNVGQIAALSWSEDSSYNALQVKLTKAMSHGVQAQASYTWAKSIDTGSASLAGDPFGNSISALFFFDTSHRRGPSDFNVGQNFVLSYDWAVPTPKSLTGVAAWFLGGWELGGIYTASSGLPFTPVIGGDPLGLKSSAVFDIPNRLVGPGCDSAVNPGNVQYIKTQCFSFPVPSTLLGNTGRNSLTGPGLSELDFSVAKNNFIKRISETFNIQFRAEMFNVLNRTNFAVPLARKTLFNANGTTVGGAGQLTATQTSSRQVQFALKVIW